MAKITDPDLLAQGVEVNFITGSKLIKLNPLGDLVPKDGITMQALYSFTKEQWRTDNNLIKFPFPFISITAEQFELVNGWNISGSISDPSSSKSISISGIDTRSGFKKRSKSKPYFKSTP
jgi:hypothetical protein